MQLIIFILLLIFLPYGFGVWITWACDLYKLLPTFFWKWLIGLIPCFWLVNAGVVWYTNKSFWDFMFRE